MEPTTFSGVTEHSAEGLEQKPFSRVFLLRLCINPKRRLMEAYIEKSGDSWQARQLVADIKLQEPFWTTFPFVATGPFSKPCRRW